MNNSLKLIGAATLLTGMLTIGSGQALAESFTTFSIGTTFGGGGGHHRGYGHNNYGHGSRSRLSFGMSTVFTGNPFYSGYNGSPYPYSSYPAYAPYETYIPRQPVYAAPPQAYYSPPPYNNSGYQNAYMEQAASPAASCVQEREYQIRINIDGNSVPAYGTACLQPDGTWLQGPAQLAQ